MQDTQDEPLFAERVAGLNIAKAEAGVTIRVPSDTCPGPPPAGDPDLRHHPQAAAVAGRLAALLGRHQGRHGGHRRYPGFSRSKVAYSQIRPVADASVTEAATRRLVGRAASRSSAGPRKGRPRWASSYRLAPAGVIRRHGHT